MFLTRFSLRNPAALFILTLLVAFGGIYAGAQLKMETMPDVSIPILSVISIYPGASPEDVEEQVSVPIEKAVRGLDGVKNVYANSVEGVSVVVLEYAFSKDLDEAKREVEEALANVALPDAVKPPSVSRLSFGSFPVAILTVSMPAEKAHKLAATVNESLVPALRGIPGVAAVEASGLPPKTVLIRLKPDKLKQYGLTASQVVQQLQANNLTFPVGKVNLGGIDHPIRVGDTFASLDQLKALYIPIFPNPSAAMAEGLKGVQEGFHALGGAVGQLGQGMGQLAQGVGTLGQSVGLLQAQVQLLATLNQAQGALFALQEQAGKLQLQLANPALSDAERRQLEGQLAQLRRQIAVQQEVAKQLAAKINALAQQNAATLNRLGRGAAPANRMPPSVAPPSPTRAQMTTPKTLKVVPLGDIADIGFAESDVESLTRTDAKPSVLLQIYKSPDANTVAVTDAVKEKIAEWNGNGEGLTVVPFFNAGDPIKESVFMMVNKAFLGALFTTLVIYLFLRHARSTLIAVVSIPLSVLIAAILLHQMGITVNVMTLGGLTVAIGRVVDDSIVVIENIYRRLRQAAPHERNVALLLDATREVAGPITSSTLTTVAVFLPLGLVSGVIGRIFEPFAYTVVAALLASLLVAVTVVPMLAKNLMLSSRDARPHRESALADAYRRVLAWSLGHKAFVLSTAFLLFLASLALMRFIDTAFVPSGKEKLLSVKLDLPPGTNLHQTSARSLVLERMLLRDPDVARVTAIIGTSSEARKRSAGQENSGPNTSQIFVQLKEEADVEQALARVRRQMGALAKANEKIVVREVNFNAPTQGQAEVIVSGPTLAVIKPVAEAIMKKMAAIPELVNVTSNLQEAKPEIVVTVDPKKAAQYGLSEAQVAGAIQEVVAPREAGEVTFGGVRYDLLVQTGDEPPASVDALRNLSISTPTGREVRVGEVAQVAVKPGPVALLRLNGEPYVSVKADITTQATGSVLATLQRELATLSLPQGVQVKMGGESQQQKEAFSQLGVAMVVAVGAVYFVMVVTFGELLAPFAILFSLPFAVTGGLLGLFLTGQPLSVSAMIGALMLIGIVVTNAIVLIDRVKKNEAAGMGTRDALLEAGSTRLRPILMTAIATVLAMSPLALGLEGSALISQGLAVVVIGGLTTSTLLTLVVVPLMYDALTRIRSRVRRNVAVGVRG